MIRLERGMALAVVMVLLLGLTVLAVAGLSGAVAAVALSGLDEQSALAFEAAEAVIARTLRSRVAPSDAQAWPDLWPQVTARAEIRADHFESVAALPEGFSLGAGGGAFATRHYTIVAEGRAGRGTSVRLEQGYAVIAPAGSSEP
jgi:hypothetical protein